MYIEKMRELIANSPMPPIEKASLNLQIQAAIAYGKAMEMSKLQKISNRLKAVDAVDTIRELATAKDGDVDRLKEKLVGIMTDEKIYFPWRD